MKILLFEDNSDHADLFQANLQLSDFSDAEVFRVTSLKDGKQLLDQDFVDLIFLDLSLPDSNATETIERIALLRIYAPIIVLTSFNDKKTILDVIKKGADDCLPKLDLTPESLERTIQYTLDRSDHKKKLRESEAKYRGLVSNLPGIVYRCLIDDNWTMVFISDEIERITGYPAHEFIGNHIRSYASIIHPEDREMVARTVATARIQSRPFTIEYRIMGKDDTVLWVYEKGQTVISEDNREWLDGTIIDISDRIRLEEKLKSLNNNLDERVQEEIRKREAGERLLAHRFRMAEVESLVEIITHRWKQPLAIISLAMENLKEGLDDECRSVEAVKHTDELIKKQIDFLAESIDTFRRFLKPSIEKQRFNVYRSIVDVLELVSSRMEKLRIQIHLEGDQVETLGYENEFKQVILNLIQNARETILERKIIGPRIDIRVRRQEEYSEIELEDNAGGIDPAYLPDRIFKPLLASGEKTRNGFEPGISYRIITESMGGSMRCENGQKGVRFIIQLPAPDPDFVN